MNKKMSLMGVGAKIAIPTLVYLAVAVAVSWFARPFFVITSNHALLVAIGLLLAVIGFALNLVAAFSMMRAHKENRLATNGFYALFRDPMYVLQIFVTLPGLFLLFNSWLALIGVIPAYIAYKVFVREEHKYLETLFGEEYREYVKKVSIRI